jgi:hypothetical protein
LQAQGQHGFDGVAGSGCRGLGEDDGVAGQGTVRVDGVVGLRTVQGAQHRGLREEHVVAGSGTALRAWGRRLCGRRRHWLGSENMVARKGHNLGREHWCRGS